MKSTGIVRKVDKLGRVVIPMEMRDKNQINVHDKLIINVHDDQIIINKYQPYCILCGENKNIKIFKGKRICIDCIKYIVDQIK